MWLDGVAAVDGELHVWSLHSVGGVPVLDKWRGREQRVRPIEQGQEEGQGLNIDGDGGITRLEWVVVAVT